MKRADVVEVGVETAVMIPVVLALSGWAPLWAYAVAGLLIAAAGFGTRRGLQRVLKRNGWAECGRCGEEYWVPRSKGEQWRTVGASWPLNAPTGCRWCRSWLWRLLAPYINRIGGRV